MRAGWWRPPRLRSNEPDEGRRATWLELFYDLVYVLAVASLASALAADPSWAGVLAFAVLFVPIWWCWSGAMFYNDRFDTGDAVHRLLTLLQMLGAVGFALFAQGGLDVGARGFAASYGFVRLVLVVMYLRAARHVPIARPLATRYAWGFSLAAALWLASSLMSPPWRFVVWAVALAIDVGTPFTARRAQALLPMSRSHLPERIGLFTIIVLGQAVASVVVGAADASVSLAVGAAVALGLSMTFCLWWVYFENLDETTVRRTRAAGQTWFYAHLPLTMGIAVAAVGVEAIVRAPTSVPDAPVRWVLGGGLALALAAMALIHATTVRADRDRRNVHRAWLRLGSAGVVLAACAAGSSLPGLALALVLVVVGAAQVALDPPGRDPHTTPAA